jgi:hypothetical protein
MQHRWQPSQQQKPLLLLLLLLTLLQVQMLNLKQRQSVQALPVPAAPLCQAQQLQVSLRSCSQVFVVHEPLGLHEPPDN